MKKSINLSLGRKRVDTALRKALYVSAGAFCLVVAVSLGFIAYRLILTNSYNSLQAEEALLDQQLVSMQEEKIMLSETKSRLAHIKRIIGKRSPITDRLTIVTSLVPEDSEVGVLRGSKSEMQVSLTSGSLSDLNTLMEEKISQVSEESANGISKVEMKSFALNPATLSYTVDLVISFQ